LFEFEAAIRLVNSFFTIGIGLMLACIYLRKRTRFISLLAWSVAFIIYGFEILLRVWYGWSNIEVFTLSIMFGVPLILGTSNLIQQNKIYAIVILISLPVATFLFPSNWRMFCAFAFFGTMTIAVIQLRLSVGKIADRFVIGWMTLFISNVLFIVILNLEWIADLFAIPAKMLLAAGMLDQRFARMVLDIKRIYNAHRVAASKVA